MWDMQKVCEAFYSIYGELIGVEFEVVVTPKCSKDSETGGAVDGAGKVL